MNDDDQKYKAFLGMLIHSLQIYKDKFVSEKISDNFYIYKQMDLLQETCEEMITRLDER